MIYIIGIKMEKDRDVLGVKTLLSQSEQPIQDDEEIRDSRSFLFEEILKILSKNSSKIRDEVTKIKKEMLQAMAENNIAGKSWEWRLWEIMEADPDSSNMLYTINVFSALKELWLWNDEKAKSYRVWLPDFDEDVRKVFKRFAEYEDYFVGCYERLATEYMRRTKKIPSYRTILKMCFCEYISRYIKLYIKNMKFNEDNFKEWFWVIQERLQEKWLVLEASDDIIHSFIQLCREKYPLAKKNYDFLFDSKKSKNEFLSLAEKSLTGSLWDTFDNIVDLCVEDVENDENLEEDLKEWTLLMNSIINVLINVNVLIDEWNWNDELIGEYFCYISDLFEESHLRKLENSKEKEKKPIKKSFWWEMLAPEKPKPTWKNMLSDRENNLINEAVSCINCEWKDSIVKYITKLKIKDLPISFYDLKRLFNLEEIPAQTESILIDQLWMDYEIEEEIIKAKEEEQEEKAEFWEDQEVIHEEIEVGDPTQYLVDKLKSVWCVFDNELTARKQIDEFCQNDSYRTVLINLMTSPRFGKVFLHKSGHKTARTLRIGMTGWRLLFAKRKDWNIHFVCFANHNTYEDRLAMLK